MLRLNIGGGIYSIEHFCEIPIEKLIFGRTRYTKDDWFFRCMGSRLLWFFDLIAYVYYSIRMRLNIWNESDWREYVKIHNNQIYFISRCDTFGSMCELNSKEFRRSPYDAKCFIKYMIPMYVKVDKKRLRRWLLHEEGY